MGRRGRRRRWPCATGRRLTEYLRIRTARSGPGSVLGPGDAQLQVGALIRDLPITEANPHVPDPKLHTDHDVRFRQVICRRRGRLLGTEIVVDGEPPQWDLRPGQS